MITALNSSINRPGRPIKINKSSIWDSPEIIQMRSVVELIRNWKDDELNILIAKYFKLKYWKETTTDNFNKFIKFLIKSIKYHIFCMKNFPTKGRPSKEELGMARKVTEFEEEYWDILYFWQRNISEEIRRQVDEILAKVIWF